MQARRGPLARQVVACYRRQVEFASLKGAAGACMDTPWRA